MSVHSINYIISLVALFGFTGSLFYMILVKIGLPKTENGKEISKILTFFSILIIYGFLQIFNSIFKNNVASYIFCILLICLLPLIFSKIISKSSKILNKISNTINGYHHQEGTPLLQFLEEKIDGIRPEKYIVVFNVKNEFITSGYMDKLSDQEDSVQQMQLIGDYVSYTFDEVIKRYNDPEQKYFEDNKIIYDFNKELKMFCFNE